MISAIEEIINGKRGKLDQIKMSEKFFENLRAASEAENRFVDKLKDYPELLELYRKASEAEEELHSSEIDDIYKSAFRFAFLIAVDVFCGE